MKTESEVLEYLAECVHVAFRKGSDHSKAHEAWKAIRDMPGEEWANVVGFILYAGKPLFKDFKAD